MSSQKAEFQGAISFGIPGMYHNVFSVDFASLYPSIMLQYDVHDPAKDYKGYFPKAMKYFVDKRFEYKDKYKKTGEKVFDDMQASTKIFVNSGYGFMGAGYLLFNYPKGASFVTEKGRELLDVICKEATNESVYDWKARV
jgi:DNA polymerase I